MNQTEIDKVRRQRVSALHRYNRNYRELGRLKKRMAVVKERVSRYSRKLQECDEILEANGLKP